MEENVCLRRVAEIMSPPNTVSGCEERELGGEYAEEAATQLGAKQWELFNSIERPTLLANVPVAEHVTLGQLAFRKLMSYTEINDWIYYSLDFDDPNKLYHSRGVFAGLEYLDPRTCIRDKIGESYEPLDFPSPRPQIMNMLFDHFHSLHVDNVKDSSSYFSEIPREDDDIPVDICAERYQHFKTKRVDKEPLFYEDMLWRESIIEDINLGSCNWYRNISTPIMLTENLKKGTVIHTPDSYPLTQDLVWACLPNEIKLWDKKDPKPLHNIRVGWYDAESVGTPKWELYAVIYEPQRAIRYSLNWSMPSTFELYIKKARERDYRVTTWFGFGKCKYGCVTDHYHVQYRHNNRLHVCTYASGPDLVVPCLFSIIRDKKPWFPLGLMINSYDLTLITEPIEHQFKDLVRDEFDCAELLKWKGHSGFGH